jgi:large subunit ribosomal protein L25
MFVLLCIQVQTDETTGNILNLVMVEADEGTMLKVNLPVVFKGEDVCPGLKKGIFLPISTF